MSTVAREYAEALFQLACEDGAEKEIDSALETVSNIFKGEPEYEELLSSPAIPVNERAAIIDSAFRGTLPENVVSFIQLLSEKGRMDEFSECVSEYRKLIEAQKAISEAVVTSAVALTADELAALKTKLEKISGKTVSITSRIDADILGGIIVELDGKVMDGSLRHRLQELKEVINK